MPRGNTPRIAIIGSGFAGIGLGVALKKAGIETFTIYERAGRIGGVWRENTYPGAACDIPSRLYSFSFEPDYKWSRHFPPQAEILAYLEHCAARHGIAPHIRFGAGVRAATFDEAAGLWRLETEDGEAVEAELLVSAVGLFNRPALPDIPGRESFAGVQFHSARWDHGYALAGKTVAVVGTGASAIQFVPAIAPEVARLVVFQRTPQYVLPRLDPGALTETGWLGRRLERLRLFLRFEKGIPRRSSVRMTAAAEARFRAHLARKIADADLRRRLTPAYPLGCKRVLQSNDWYDALQRPNVALVDTPIAAAEPAGLRTADGKLHEADAIVYGTGFTPTDYLSSLRVVGPGGRELSEAWRGGAEAYLGLTVSGFPNFFMLYGPNTNVAGSIVYMLESQARYVVSAVRCLMRRKARRMSVIEGAQRRFNAEVQRRIARTVLVHETCHSYFRTATGKVTTQWPGFLLEYRRRTRRVRTRDYEFA